MSVTYQKPVQIDLTSWQVDFSSDQATPVSFRVYLAGRLIDSFRSGDGSGSVIVNVAYGDQPFLEVLDRDCQVPSLAFPGRVVLGWQGSAAEWKVEENVASVWTERATVSDDGQGAFRWQTRWLEDETSHQFRVTPIDADGNAGTPLSFSFLMVRHPDAPSVSYAINPSTGQITISSV